MASYHFHTKHVTRSKGYSSVGAIAYRTASRLRDERTGELFDFTRRRGVAHTEMVFPQSAQGDDHWARDRDRLWNAAEAAEKRKDARPAREFELSLPHELEQVDRVALARAFAREIADRYNIAVDFAVHKPHRSGDQRNHHAHILTTTRELGSSGLGPKAALEWSNTDRAKHRLMPTGQEIKVLRGRWGQLTNELLQQRNVAARVDHRTLKEQGIDREPTTHLGRAVMGMQRCGIETEVGKRVAWEQEWAAQERLARAWEEGRLERESAGLEKSIIDVTTDLAAARQERAVSLSPSQPGPEEWLRKYQNVPRPSAQESSRAAIQDWRVMREGLARARAFEHLAQEKALAGHPELKSTYEGWNAFESEMAVRFADDIDRRQQHLSAGRRNMIERLQKGELFTPRAVSAQALAERLALDSEQSRAERTNSRGLELDGPDFDL